MPYLTAGDPDLDTTAELLSAVAESGADIIELGIPFSDPLMDGPVIQEAGNRALAAGTTPPRVMEMVAAIRPKVEAGLLYMVPSNLVWRYGPGRFAGDAAAAGVDGVLITDLPPEEAGEWQELATSAGLETIYLLAPTSSPERIRRVARLVTGFIYCISRRGVTGPQDQVPDELVEVVQRIRAETALPVAVGFGIATVEHVRKVTTLADGAVVGSALVAALAAAPDRAARLDVARRMVAELKAGTRRAG